MVDRFFCGIDFGTSNSAVCAGRRNELSLVPLEEGQVTIPSAVFFNTDEKRVSYGRKAMAEYTEGYEGRLMRSLKSLLGSELMDEATHIGTRRINFRSIIGLFIAELKSRAELGIGAPLENVVMGRPVRFDDDDDNADQQAEDDLREIAKAQGFKNIYFEYEPLAAARDYESRISKEETVLVFDIGGGTSDFSVIRLSPEARERHEREQDILANAGVHIGGTNFDQKLSLETVMRDLGFGTKLKSGLDMPRTPYFELSTWHLINQMYSQKNMSAIRSLLPSVERRDLLERFVKVQEFQRGHELVGKVEQAKIDLSAVNKTVIDLSDIEKQWKITVAATELQKAIDQDIERIISTAESTVKLAGIGIDDIDAIFMTGGSTGLPGFEERIAKKFPLAKIQHGDRFSSVAKGLGWSAQEYFR